ncbi:MAG: low molecular weight phosphotyrosine protein phosphatase [Gammaproteobacteria bacterium]|nr:low molecular weight phosphotyrosine protein phosphatase [Gammaproteobacteria bacterium]
MIENKQVSIIFVCMGNICRSPTAHGVFQALVNEHKLNDAIGVESAGTHSYHIGSPPDLRSQATALKNDVNLSGLKARRFIREDFDKFDYIIGMDASNIADIRSIEPDDHEATVALMLDYSKKYSRKEVPDPYFGNDGFDMVFDMIEDASMGLLDHIRRKHNL